MAQWKYKTSRHTLAEIPTGAGAERVFACDDKGHCLVHDLQEKKTEELEDILNEEGKKGWELVQCQYHATELFCLWKKQEEKS